jgi:hypothetical protein
VGLCARGVGRSGLVLMGDDAIWSLRATGASETAVCFSLCVCHFMCGPEHGGPIRSMSVVAHQCECKHRESHQAQPHMSSCLPTQRVARLGNATVGAVRPTISKARVWRKNVAGQGGFVHAVGQGTKSTLEGNHSFARRAHSPRAIESE